MMHRMCELALVAFVLLAVTGFVSAQAAAPAPAEGPSWTQTGWGGGGFYWAAVFHPTQDGVIYLAGDVAGVYRSDDHGKNFRMINNGLADYGVFSLAVDRTNPQTVYAATSGGLCKSTDGGEHWQLLPKPGAQSQAISGIKGRSIRCIAVDPTDGKIVYAASPAGKVYKSTDGGATWAIAYEKKADAQSADSVQVQFGQVTADYFGGFWTPLQFPAATKTADCVGFGFRFQGGTAKPRETYVTLTTASGAPYRSRNISDIFTDGQWRDIVLGPKDFSLAPDYAAKNADKAAALPAAPDWSTVNRMDLVCVGDLPQQASVARFGRAFFAMGAAGAEQAAPAKLVTVKDFAKDEPVRTYGNVRVAGAGAGGKPAEGQPIYSVAVAAKQPAMVLAATDDAGIVMSSDAGQTWRELPTPKKASSIAIAESDPSIIYASFFRDGVWKSTDKGETWKKSSQGIGEQLSATEIVVSPTDPQDVYLVGGAGWGGAFYFSHDGGNTWQESSQMTADRQADPTLPAEAAKQGISAPSNLTINPLNPKELFISANWRCAWSDDAGRTWHERDRGADISCVYDIRFSGERTYACAMDEGTLVSDDNGKNWRQLWPLKWAAEISGHNWRLAVDNANGVDRVIATCSPWDKFPNRVIRSDDGGKTYSIITAGLPQEYPKANTMWEKGYIRAMAVDPNNRDVVYVGIDGDPADGKSGGGIFKSEDGGKTFQQLPNQPASRRMFFGLAVDPTDSNRIYWGACAKDGGLHRSEDGGATWQRVFSQDEWIFNVLVTADGTVYCPGHNLWRSTDHGRTWTQLTKLDDSQVIVALEVHPRDPKTMWFSRTTWDGSSNGAVYKTTDGGTTWQEITGNLPNRKPMVLRFNPQTNELWAGGPGLYKLAQ